jgi:maltooligosyltrehalose trehalohydrolase
VSFLQNHDQVANSARGERVHAQTSPGVFRAMTALLLLAPATPMLFMGQELCASSPFLFFADHGAELAEKIRHGREEFLSQFPSLASPELAEGIPDPADRATFERCKLDLGERETHAAAYALHEDLLRLRREDPVFRAQRGAASGGLDGAVLGQSAFVLRFFGPEDDDRLLLINLGHDLHLVPAPEPLLAPPEERRWEVLWSSESPRYGGVGSPPPEDEGGGWSLPGHAATVLQPALREGKDA